MRLPDGPAAIVLQIRSDCCLWKPKFNRCPLLLHCTDSQQRLARAAARFSFLVGCYVGEQGGLLYSMYCVLQREREKNLIGIVVLTSRPRFLFVGDSIFVITPSIFFSFFPHSLTSIIYGFDLDASRPESFHILFQRGKEVEEEEE